MVVLAVVFRIGRSRGKPLLLPMLKKPPPGPPKPPPGPPKQVQTDRSLTVVFLD